MVQHPQYYVFKEWKETGTTSQQMIPSNELRTYTAIFKKE